MIETKAPIITPPIQRWRLSGNEPMRASRLNQTVDAINGQRRGVRPVRQLPIRVTKKDAPPGATGRFVFSAMRGDWVLAHPVVDGAVDNDVIVLLAKPWLLRRTPFDGQVRGGKLYQYENDTARVASIDNQEERQLVIDRFFVGDVLYATKDVIGGSGVFDGEGVELDWLMQSDGRAWAKEA